MSGIGAVDLFCGAGGMTHGLIKSGIPVIAGFDIDPSCSYPFETNNESDFVCRDIAEVTPRDIREILRPFDVKVIVGCAPCQPFSSHTQKDPKRTQSPKWQLMVPFAELVVKVKPEVVSMENVPQAANFPVFGKFLRALKGAGYHVSWSVVRCADYGVPQTRKRLVLLASRLGPIQIVKPTYTERNWKTVRHSIGKMEPLEAGGSSTRDQLHSCMGMTEVNIRRIRMSKAGGTWRDWDKGLRSPCHCKRTGSKYPGVYARMAWEEPSPTITTQFYCFGTGRFGHPEQDRAVSLREGALLQTFPRHYDFVDPRRPFSFDRFGRHIGNAVPVRLAAAVGKSILRHAQKKD